MAESLGYDSLSPSVSLALDQDLRIDVNSYLSDLIDMEYRGARRDLNARDAADEQSFEQLLAKVRRMSSDFSESGVSAELVELAKTLPEQSPVTQHTDHAAGGLQSINDAEDAYPSKDDGHARAEGSATSRRAARQASRRSRRSSRIERKSAANTSRGRRAASHKQHPDNQPAVRQVDSDTASTPRKGRHRRAPAEPPRTAKRRRSRHASPKSTSWYVSRWSIVLICAALMALTVFLAYL